MAVARMRCHRMFGLLVKAMVLVLAILYITEHSASIYYNCLGPLSLANNSDLLPSRPCHPPSTSRLPPDTPSTILIAPAVSRAENLVIDESEEVRGKNEERVREESERQVKRENEGTLKASQGQETEENEKQVKGESEVEAAEKNEGKLREESKEHVRDENEGALTGKNQEKGEGESEEEARGRNREPEEDTSVDSFTGPNNLNITYLTEERSFCSDPEMKVFFYVHSGPDNSRHRHAIRATWGNPKWFPVLQHKVLFVMGKPEDEETLAGLLQESRIHRDILLADFRDSYHNLTYKAVSALHWVHKHCTTPKFIAKSDDDIMINLFALAKYLKVNGGGATEDAVGDDEHPTQPGNNVKGTDQRDGGNIQPGIKETKIHCHVWNHSRPFRNTKSKFYVSRSDYKKDTYPPFCSGSAFIMDRQAVPSLLTASASTPFLRLDDVFITGLSRVAAGVKLVSINKLYKLRLTTGKKFDPSLLENGRLFFHLPHKYISQVFESAWDLVLKKENVTGKSVRS